ncbi:MAG: hypothetical protein AAGA93_22075 [Actinomycetota bacterium]
MSSRRRLPSAPTGRALAAVVAYVVVKWAVILTAGTALIRAGRGELLVLIPIVALTAGWILRRRRGRSQPDGQTVERSDVGV